jgi:hypothetical protein
MDGRVGNFTELVSAFDALDYPKHSSCLCLDGSRCQLGLALSSA